MKAVKVQHALIFAGLLAAAGAALAQDITIGTILELEDKIKIKKMTDELTKNNGQTPVAPAPIIALPPPAKVYPTETLEIHGVDHVYTGLLTMGGVNYRVQKGAMVNGYVVASISPAGIELRRLSVEAKKGGKRGKSDYQKQTSIFAPLSAR